MCLINVCGGERVALGRNCLIVFNLVYLTYGQV